ncbi:MAG TPA: glycine zipper family protein [Thermodesulfovibrionales bacterium]|nr:glycine zipper family protein [Thermodesulfovibrionales bacterium]
MMKRNIINIIVFLSLAMLTVTGCATIPSGPSVMSLPGPGKTLEQFQADDAICRQWAAQQIGLSPQETVNQNTATGAAVGTAIGAGLGAAIGAASGHAGSGAAIGAGTGLLVGTTSGANAGQFYGREAQRRYDIAYMQCMYAKGNDIPGFVTRPRRSQRIVPPPPPPGSDYSTPYPDTPPPAQ